jgi:hypothetical protein
MRPLLGLVLSLSLLVGLGGCRGPKGAPDSSVKSFYSAVSAQDFEAMAATLAQPSLAKLGGPGRAQVLLADQFGGWSDVEVSVEDWSIDRDERQATVRFVCSAQVIRNYKPVRIDCSETLPLLKESDGKWHVVLGTNHGLRIIQ